MATRSSRASRRVRLRPHDPFDLIRLLARSQSDPRKAVAELVQNSLDAGARRVEITWFNEKGRRALAIWDDGGGVFPDLEREEALKRIASTIGHSHKLDLTPSQRREHLVQGQYGIGLIGFWSIGSVLEMKSRVGGGRAVVLRLREDRAQGEVFASRSRLIGEPDTFTEVTIRDVHPAAVNKIRPPRLQAYLATELRGQLLDRGAVVRIRDRVARGRARKQFVVEPKPYLGRPVPEWKELEVPGFESARIELYLVAPDEDRRGVVALSCGGTVVLDDLAEIDGVDAPRAPWSSGRLEGVIDFPELHVAPGTRRGFSHDEPVGAFLAALEGLERAVTERLAEEAERRRAQRREHLAREIRKAFRSVARQLPQYDFFTVAGEDGGASSPSSETRSGGGGAGGRRGAEDPPSPGGEALPGDGEDRREEPEEPTAPEEAGDDRAEGEAGLLFPPGPLARLEPVPRRLRLQPGATRTVRARLLDGDGRPCRGPVEVEWRLEGPGRLRASDRRAEYAAPEPDDDTELAARLLVTATQGDVRLEASVRVQVAPPDASARLRGIPDPVPVSAPGEPWRSRVVDGRWEYNDAHRDYLSVCEQETRRLRYLVHLFAKEIVLRNFGGPGDAETLERMIEVLTRLDVGRGR